jgi:predicted RNase H-like HicB family nuclease
VLTYPEREGGYSAAVPALPGCVTESDTRAELLANLAEAVQGCLLVTPGNACLEPGCEVEEIDL